jgi:hypothetical protein
MDECTVFEKFLFSSGHNFEAKKFFAKIRI